MIRVAVLIASAVTAVALTLPSSTSPPLVANVAPIGAPVLVAHSPATTTTTAPPPTTTTTTTAPPVTAPPPPPPTTRAPTPPRPPVTTARRAPAATAPASHRWTCPAAVAAIAAAGAPSASLTTWDAIAWRESRCVQWAHRQVGGDDSYCWWQIEYGHGLGASRTARYGSAQSLLYSSSACARAAMDLYRSAGWGPWS